MNKPLNVTNNLNNPATLTIANCPDELTAQDAIMTAKDVNDGFERSVNCISFKFQEFTSFISDVEKEFGELEKYDFSRGKNSHCCRFANDRVRIYSQGNSLDIVAEFIAKNDADLAQIWKIYTKNCKDDDSIDLFMSSYFMNGPQLDESTKMMKLEEVEYISDKYYPYINTDVMFDRFFTGSENILLLVGDPGLGKSKMSTLAMKHAFLNSHNLPYDKLEINASLEYQYISVGYVKSIDVLKTDKFWRQLEKTNHDFVIIDDLDYMLTKRDAEVNTPDDQAKNAFLNQFLSFTDGVEKHKTKFIITTNQRYDDIDIALLRKGRLFDILELRKLDKNEALAIWLDNDLDETDFNELFKTHEILPAELGSEINKRLNTRIDTSLDDYLLEDGISKVQKVNTHKRIGV